MQNSAVGLPVEMSVPQSGCLGAAEAQGLAAGPGLQWAVGAGTKAIQRAASPRSEVLRPPGTWGDALGWVPNAALVNRHPLRRTVGQRDLSCVAANCVFCELEKSPELSTLRATRHRRLPAKPGWLSGEAPEALGTALKPQGS
jgi:hypothetical protein